MPRRPSDFSCFNVDNDLQMSMTVNTAACSDGSAFIISVWSSLRKSVISCTDVGTLEYKLRYLSAKIPAIPCHLMIPPPSRRYVS